MNAFLWAGLTGTILIGLIMVLRFTARKRLPGRLFVWLWMVAVIRLCFPLSISVQLPSLPQPIQNLMPVPTKEIRESGEKPEKTSDISTSEPGDSVNTITMKTTDKEAETDLVYIPETERKADYKADHIKVWSAEKLLNLIWITGALCCLLFHTLRGRNERKVLNQAIPISKKVERKLYQNTLGFCQNRIDIRYFGFKKNGQLMIPFFLSDRICTPSAFGVFRQKIILPAHLSLEDGRSLGYVLLHEMVHIRKRDNLMKLIALAAVCLHWFNPFVWMMLYFLERDIELSCDQEVLSLLGKEERREYAGSLLALAAEYERYGILSSGFGKKELKERVVSIMKYKEKTRKSVLAAVLILILSMSVFVRAENSVIVNAEDPETVKMDKDWITRRYYDASGTLKSTQERYFNENSQLIGENYYYEMGEALGSTNEYILDEKGRFQEGTMYSLDGNFLAATSGYEYDEKDRLLHVTQTGEEENGDTKQFSYEYDDHDQCVKATTVFDHGEHQRDVRTENTYDADLLIRSISYSKTYAVADGPENAEEIFSSDVEFLYDEEKNLIRENHYRENGDLQGYFEYGYAPIEKKPVEKEQNWTRRNYYDADGTLKAIQERFSDENDQLIRETFDFLSGEPRGSIIEYLLDGKGRIREANLYADDGTLIGKIEGYVYDEKDRVNSYTQSTEDDIVEETFFEYDTHDRCVKTTDRYNHGEYLREERTENTYAGNLLIRSTSYYKFYAASEAAENAEELFGSDAEFLYDDNGKLIRENRYSENGVLIEYYEYEYAPVEMEVDTSDREVDISQDAPELSLENMNAETSIEKALSYLSILYSGKAFKKELCTSTYEETNDWYVVNVNDEDYNYEVFIDAEDGMLCYLYYSAQGIDWEANACTLPDGLIEEKYGMVKAAVQEIYGNNKDFISTSCEYNLKIEDHIIPHGNINYLFEFENDQAVRVLYNVQEDTFWMIQYLGSYEAYENQGFGEYAENHNREQGIERQKIYFDSLNE